MGGEQALSNFQEGPLPHSRRQGQRAKGTVSWTPEEGEAGVCLGFPSEDGEEIASVHTRALQAERPSAPEMPENSWTIQEQRVHHQ